MAVEVGGVVAIVRGMDRRGLIFGAASGQDLASVLAAGNTPGANDIAMGTRSITFGGVRIGEGAAAELLVDNGAGGAARLTVAGTVGESLALDGISDTFSLSDTVTIEWSNSTDHTDPKDLRLRRTGGSALEVDDGAGGAATLSCPGAGVNSEQFGAGAVADSLRATALGDGAAATANETIAGGRNSTAQAAFASAYGSDSDAIGASSVALGYASNISASGAIGIGAVVVIGASHTGSVAMGRGTITTAARQFVMGTNSGCFTDEHIGEGVSSVLPVSITYHGTRTDTTETDVGGASIVWASGEGTGDGTISTISFRTSNLVGTGTSQQTLTTRLTLDAAAALFGVPVGLPSFTVAGVPSAAVAGRLIFVSDETGGAVPAFSDGTNFRRVTDRAIVA